MSAKPNVNRWAIAVVAAVGMAGGYLYWRSTWVGSSNPLESTKVVPQDALMAAYVITDEGQWSKLDEFGTPGAQAAIARTVADLEANLLAQTNLDYKKDLQPWIGNVTLAIVPSSPTSVATTSLNSDLLLIVGIKNPFRAWWFTRNLKSQTELTLTEFNYKGVTVSQIVPPNGIPTYQATLNHKLVISQQRSAVEKAIDTTTSESSFLMKSGAKELVRQSTKLDNALVHFYLPDYSQTIGPMGNRLSDRPSLPPVEGVKSVLLSAGVHQEGMRMRFLTEVDPQSIPQSPPVSNKLLNRFPAETIALVNGHGIGRSWSTVVGQSQAQPELQGVLLAIRQMFAAVNLDVDREVFGWMDGEFGLGLISSNQGLLGQLGFGGAVVFETSDRPAAEAMLQKLDAIGRNVVPFPLAIAERNVSGINVREWKIPLQGALLGHGWLDDNSLFIAFGGPIIDAIATPATSLQQSPTFQAIAGSLPNPNHGYLYLDMEQITSVINTLPFMMGTPISPQTLDLLNSVRGIGATGTWTSATQFESEMLFTLKKTREIVTQ
ncbi:DUF3352 domain-containing protein [Laspinema olomoucense]|uniref:DUF3352 domain-containing protein n=1 Tax=Laspinema olomoucense TaxID=3231600 RepID=UPI0021BADBF2|nr:DUF3352 domain-containing protein [Laspinema sp. D3a]MCT7990257.1 DUF3352 domain-containing protein [Laspinema sp. D3a]